MSNVTVIERSVYMSLLLAVAEVRRSMSSIFSDYLFFVSTRAFVDG